MSFEKLNKKVAKLARSRFSEPTDIQNLVIPEILSGKNVLIIAGTGLGKTESAVLPIFSKIMEKEHKPVPILYITPMKSLNRDMFDRLLWWCNKLDLDASVRHGDTTQYERKLQVEHPPHLLITTPEQIQAMVIGKRLRKILENIKFIVVDELHEIVEGKRGVQLTVGIERLRQLCGDPQIIALSATVGSPEKAAKFIFGNKGYKIIRSKSEGKTDLLVNNPIPDRKDKEIAEKIFVGEGVAARVRMIYELMKSHRSALAFTNTREAAEVLSSRLRMLDKEFPHEVHHSSLSKEVRIKAEKEFKAEKLKSLIATSSLELGIDIGSIDLVLQYMSPRQVSKLVQRIGRSGHGVGRTSKGIIITGEGDDIFESTVIAKKALKGELEELKIYKNPLDVLAHQIVGFTMFDYAIDPKETLKTIKESGPFSSLTEKKFMEVVKFLEQLRIIFVDKQIKRRRKVFEYYFENLSVIPNNKSYRVIDLTTSTFVGTLDERFIATHGNIGSSFIVKGRPWKVLSVEEGKVYVEGINDIESSVPAWKGELIPVPFDVADEVGKLRGDILKWIEKGDAVKKIQENYPVDKNVAKKMISLIKKQVKKYPLPVNKSILIERYREYVVMHTCFGTRVNDTISRFLSALLSAEYGGVIMSKCDPYRIILKACQIKDIVRILNEYKPGDLKAVLEKALPNSSLFKWRFIHVAKRFGAIRKGAVFDRINIEKLIDVYLHSPIYDETFNELYVEKLDLEKTKEILKQIQEKKIKIKEIEGLSPLGKLGFSYELHDVVKPDRPEKEIFKIFKNRLMNTKVRLVCVNCGKYSQTKYVKDVNKEPRCVKCSSKLLAIVRPHRVEVKKIIKKRLDGKTLTTEEEKVLEEVKKSADVVINYGKLGIICLAGRGVGPATAFRILSKYRKDEDELFRHILAAEKEYIKTKRFWD